MKRALFKRSSSDPETRHMRKRSYGLFENVPLFYYGTKGSRPEKHFAVPAFGESSCFIE
jgi:hypothetical protein